MIIISVLRTQCEALIDLVAVCLAAKQILRGFHAHFVKFLKLGETISTFLCNELD